MAINDAIIANPSSTSRCPACRTIFKPYELFYKEAEEDSNSKPTIIIEDKTEPKGWLIVHDENAPSQTFDLFPGINGCGRNPEKTGNIVKIITNDLTMGRNHFRIEVISLKGTWCFILKDCESLNHTYIDTQRLEGFTREMKKLRKEEEFYIEDGAIIQAGRTKIHFKKASQAVSKEEVSRVIQSQKYTKTIIV